jgi:hypothetical protein
MIPVAWCSAALDSLTLSYNTVSMDSERRYTLAELAGASAAALDALGVEARNGQVRDRPDTRTIRYYATLGLVDRPAEMSGRTALYGDRHLLQVLAVKALQAHGASLAEVQRSLVGASAAELRRAIGPGLPAALAAAAGPAATRSAAAAPAAPAPAAGSAGAGSAATGSAPTGSAATRDSLRHSTFWRTPPSAPAPAGLRPTAGPDEAAVPGTARRARILASGTVSERAATTGEAGAAMQPRRLTAIPLAPGATLLVDSGLVDTGLVDTGSPEAADVTALREAAGPLLSYLTDAGLLPGSPTNPGADT